jgi:amino acid transporter
MPSPLRRLLIGRPIATDKIEEEKVGPLGGLALFAPDAMSSVAYGPEEVLIVLVAAGAAGLSYAIPVGIALTMLVAVVATSYRQTVQEYPSGGGAYVVARENLGVLPAQIAGAALLTDYVLTVAVSVASGAAAVTSAFPQLLPYHVEIAVTCVAVIMLVNLRGVRESAAAFSIPVYGFIVCVLTVVLVGLSRLLTGSLEPLPERAIGATEGLTAFLVLRAFSSGCASLTGIEAVANGVQAFREPRGRNAAMVMLCIAVVLGTTVLGVSILAHRLNITPQHDETVMSQIGECLFGRTAPYYVLQAVTALILIFAANTSFSDFPRLSAFMARDGYMPRQMLNLGDRLVFQNGIVVLAGLAGVLVVAFHGEVTRLLPLYAVGVFTAFTTSQTGMVVHWLRKGGPGARTRAVVNGLGAVCTGVVLAVIAATKFVHGAWVICLLIPAMVGAFRAVGRHYRYVASRLTLDMAPAVKPVRNLNLLLVGGIHRGTLEALQYMRTEGAEARAIHVEVGGEAEPRVLREWAKWESEIPLEVVACPHRDLAGTLLQYIQSVQQSEGYDYVTLVVPEFVVGTWWESLLHNHTAFWIQFALRGHTGIAILNMRYRL